MHRVRVVAGYFLLACFTAWNLPSSAQADTVWSAVGGAAQWEVYEEQFADVGITIQLNDAAPKGYVELTVRGDESFKFATAQDRVSSLDNNVISFVDSIRLISARADITVTDLHLVLPQNADGDEALQIHGAVNGRDITLFTASAFKSGFNPMQHLFGIETGNLALSQAMADQLGIDPQALSIPGITLTADVAWTGGDDPLDTTPIELGGAPRGGNGGTECSQPIGQDLIVGELYGSSSGNEPSQQIGGVWYDTFSAGTTSCNIGDTVLAWEGSGGTVHPVIGQNFFRLKNGRFEQIGQSWLKHGFTVAAGNECGCGCTGPGGPTLHPGCSDPYGPGLNNSQSSIKPKFRVNPKTGVHTHGGNPTFTGTVARRLQVRHTDLNSALNPGARYFIEGQYVHEQDASLDNDDNNASYREVTVASTGANEYAYTMIGSTIREQPAIRAWRAIDPTVHLTDSKIANDGLYIIGAKASENEDGTWHYEYAVHNLNSHRGVRSFSIPVSPAAVITNIGFHDVDYHDGDGQGSVTRNGTDWEATVANGAITWNMLDMGENSNALLWGTLYNFRFDANLQPAAELTEATLGFFRPAEGQPDAFTADTIGPTAVAVGILIADGSLPYIMATCQETSFLVTIRNGSEIVDPASPTLHYSYDGGDFLSQPLVPMGDDVYQAVLPAPQCGDSPRYYVSAAGDQGTLITSPAEDAPFQYYTAQVGVEVTNTWFQVDFESGLPAGWTMTGQNGHPSLWNIGTSCSSNPTGNCGGSDGTNVAYYGKPDTCDYNTGGLHDGSLRTGEIALPQSSAIQLTYCSAFQRHLFAAADEPKVIVTPAGGEPQVVDEPWIGITGNPVWAQRTVDLTEFGGQTVTIEWNFSNQVALADNYFGWAVDNAKLTVNEADCTPGCGEPDGDLNADTVANGLDISIFAAGIINQSTDPVELQHADFDGSGTIDLGDVDGMVAKLLE